MEHEVRLRDLRREDLPVLHRWYQAAELWDHLVGEFVPREESEALAYMDRWLAPSSVELRLGAELTDAQGSRLVGLATFSPMDLERGWAELHTLIGDASDRGRGLGAEIVAALLERGWALGLTRIELRVLETNAAARRSYERCGFQVTGRAQPATKHGRPVEVLIMEARQPRSATT